MDNIEYLVVRRSDNRGFTVKEKKVLPILLVHLSREDEAYYNFDCTVSICCITL